MRPKRNFSLIGKKKVEPEPEVEAPVRRKKKRKIPVQPEPEAPAPRRKKKKRPVEEDDTDFAPKKLKVRAEKKKGDLEDEMEEVEELLDNPQFTENTYFNTYGHMFHKIKKIMIKTETLALDTNKTAHIYALMQLYNQMREIISDIRSIADLSQQSAMLIQDVLRPTFKDVFQNFTDMIYHMKKDARSRLAGPEYKDFEAALDKYIMEHGNYLHSSYQRASERITTILTES